MAERVAGFARSSRTFDYSKKARGGGVKAEGGEEEEDVKADYSSSDESDGPKMDVEYISLLDDEPSEDDEPAGWGNGAPVRVPRSEHVDRQAMVNTESSNKKSKAEIKAMKEKEMTFETDIFVKDEPEDDEEGIKAPPSPETRRRVKVTSSPEAVRRKDGGTRRRRSSAASRKPVISTTEEKEEFERLEADRVFALNELGGGSAEAEAPAVEIKKTDGDGDLDMAAEAPAVATAAPRNSETENQIFFFQFPPLLPHLVPASTPVKPDPAGDDVEVKPDPAPVKKSALKGRALLKSQMALLTAPPAPGLVGKLRVHKSGRISMLWGTADSEGEGEIAMEVSRGAHCEFLQEVVVMKEQSPYGDGDVDEKGRTKGIAYSLGQVKGKYVVSPDFGSLLKAGSARRKAKKVEITEVDE